MSGDAPCPVSFVRVSPHHCLLRIVELGDIGMALQLVPL